MGFNEIRHILNLQADKVDLPPIERARKTGYQLMNMKRTPLVEKLIEQVQDYIYGRVPNTNKFALIQAEQYVNDFIKNYEG